MCNKHKILISSNLRKMLKYKKYINIFQNVHLRVYSNCTKKKYSMINFFIFYLFLKLTITEITRFGVNIF